MMESTFNLLKKVSKCCMLLIIALILVWTLTTKAWAGGLYLQEFGTPSMGVASAGAEAVAADASTSFHNPAGMTRVDGKEFMLTGGLLFTNIEFDPAPITPVPGGDGGNAGGFAPLLGGFYTHSITDKLKFGVNMISLSAAVVDYDDNWTGRYLNEEVSIFTITLNPTIAYKVNDWFSIAGGVGAVFAKLKMEVAIPTPGVDGRAEIDGDDISATFNLGALFEPTEKTRIGIIYWYKTDLDFEGDTEINPLGLKVGFDTSLPLVQFIRTGIYHEINRKFALLGTVAWENWSDFDNQNISVGRGSTVIQRNWDDTWHFAGGIHYRPSQPWLLQAGIAYDTSPVDAVDRTPDMPIDRQWRYSFGAQYELSEKVNIGGIFEYADLGKAEILNPLLIGDYKSNEIFFFAFNVNWKF
jgi:long-chain fatty acid transport protein